jgi:hypothetical protein
MKRWVPLLLVPFVLVPIGLAQDAANLSEHPDRLRQFQRNYALIESLVQGGVRLAAANQPLQRVEHCIALLRSLRDELRQAAHDGDGPRVVELAKHVRSLLHEGVVTNLELARQRLVGEPALDGHLTDALQGTLRVAYELEQEIQSQMGIRPAVELMVAQHVIQEARKAVEDLARLSL